MACLPPARSLPRPFAPLLALLLAAPAWTQDAPAISRPAPAAPDDTAPELREPEPRPAAAPLEGEEPRSQFSRGSSPSGLALGVLDKEVDSEGLPEELEALAKEGALASADQDWARARAVYEKMISAAPRNALAYANLGVVDYRIGNYEAARTALRRSLQLNPSISQNWLTLGLVYHAERNLELAISSLARAIHQDPQDPRARLYMAVVIHDYGWGSAAETELHRAIQLDPQYADAHFNLALMHLEKDPPALELARRHYYVAIDLGAAPDPEVEKQLAAPPLTVLPAAVKP